ncbi:MAG: DUF4125 family protein [Acidaminococcaceae bacterium]
MMKTREENLARIIAIETEMFTAMKTEEAVPANTLPAFKKMRWMTYSVLSDATIALWCQDLEQARQDGRNVMIEKYAMISGQLPLPEGEACCCNEFSGHAGTIAQEFCGNDDIQQIVDIESNWQNKLAAKYPKSIQRQQESAALFKKYAICELYTWAPASRKSYLADVKLAVQEGRNLPEERYNNLYASIGKGSLREVEEAL